MAGNGALDARDRGATLGRLAAERFDVLVIGGGITGAGAALDAASRGLRVALVETRDLASGTSSRSSKLIHGGLRYLEQFDFKLVWEALRERDLLVSKLAPHLVKPVSFLYPLHRKVLERPYVGAGLVLSFDVHYSGLRNLDSPRYPIIDWPYLDAIRAEDVDSHPIPGERVVAVGQGIHDRFSEHFLGVFPRSRRAAPSSSTACSVFVISHATASSSCTGTVPRKSRERNFSPMVAPA